MCGGVAGCQGLSCGSYRPVAVAQFQFAGVGFRAVVADCGQIPLPTDKPETLALKPIICRGEMPGLH
jgi:hypothetical protein